MSPAAWGTRKAVLVRRQTVHYRRAGREGRPVIILLHGSPESASALHAIAARLALRLDG